MTEEKYYIRFTSDGPIHESTGHNDDSAFGRLLIKVTDNAKRGLVIVNGSYGTSGLRALGGDHQTYPLSTNQCRFVHTQAEHDEWLASEAK